MSGFITFLKQWTPNTGRFIRESGSFANIADIARETYDTNTAIALKSGRVYQASWRGELEPSATVLFKQGVTSGDLRGISLAGTIQGGRVEYALLVGAVAGATLETVDGYNGDRRLLGTDEFTSANPVLRVGALTGGVVVDQSFTQTPATGSGRTSTGLSGAGIGGIYDAASSPSFSLTNVGTATAQIALTWIWQELGDE